MLSRNRLWTEDYAEYTILTQISRSPMSAWTHIEPSGKIYGSMPGIGTGYFLRWQNMVFADRLQPHVSQSMMLFERVFI